MKPKFCSFLLTIGMCTCVEPWSEDGHLFPNGTTAFISTILDLKCYDESIHTPDYFRPCEKVIYDLEVNFVMSITFKDKANLK